MKRRALEKRLTSRAKRAGVEWRLIREGANHSVWSFGGMRITIPRHNEINELTALGILRAAEVVAQVAEDDEEHA